VIAIVDYGAGNVASVRKALAHLGAAAVVTAEPQAIAAAPLVVFPGQGHFGQSMASLRAAGLDEVLRDVVAGGRPFFGICLGLQLLFEGSDEAPGVAGLGLLRGRCRRFEPPLRVPHIGWNAVRQPVPPAPDPGAAPAPWGALPDGEHVYFVHSYHAVAAEPADVALVSDYAQHRDGPRQTFVAAVQRDNLLAAQFHPEKSGAAGLALWRAVLAWAQAGDPC
jgi:glutamine amidotransferase